MLDVAKINPVIKSETDTTNHSFMTFDGDLYLIANELTGDDAYKEGVVIPAGEFLNGYLVKAWDCQKLVVDGKHIKGEYATYSVKGTKLVADTDGKLKTTSSTPESGVYFVVTDTCTLTEKAVKVKVVAL